MKYRAFAATHVGRRSNNEDAYRVDSQLGVYVLADGMGGYEGGEVAARIGVDTVHGYFERAGSGTDPGFEEPYDDQRTVAESRVEVAFRLANREVLRQRRGELAEMGSTLAMLIVRDSWAVVAHVGDSRVYRFRSGVLEQLTADHSLYAEILRTGSTELPASHNFVHSNAITRAIGSEGSLKPDVRTLRVTAGDRFLLCSDGVSDVLSNSTLADRVGASDLYRVADHLVLDAYEARSRDNMTVVVVEAFGG